ncbi:hypothetical protein F441_13683 [Phytophthora nicotianae CJ01A1]|uniref:Uncharacterized protein n=3 Tax=Phytophthora nicotianae TaxID=4792 RepID=W2YUP4_PHYNI|nr:hypothetical protein F444_13813 [Phytophthora nicotianae P1976]ETP10709.1 hypothetical protein F441_13683 [Phytophthora nicotianae CJ01A1]ETP38867.1 hypothetical protein F442_13607 [Phytophthora nicotianae P10297]
MDNEKFLHLVIAALPSEHHELLNTMRQDTRRQMPSFITVTFRISLQLAEQLIRRVTTKVATPCKVGFVEARSLPNTREIGRPDTKSHVKRVRTQLSVPNKTVRGEWTSERMQVCAST